MDLIENIGLQVDKLTSIDDINGLLKAFAKLIIAKIVRVSTTLQLRPLVGPMDPTEIGSL